MHIIQSNGHQLELGSIAESTFSETLDRYSGLKKIILTDENTAEACVGYLITTFDQLSEAEVIVVPAGESSKSLDIVENIYEVMTEYGIGRHDLIINVGGGLITDLGGFIASCYKRGVSFINIPTSLLAMVDASIGGKTGVNLGVFKNQIGAFNTPIAVYIDPLFLSTLPENELMSGYAELLKHGLISDASLFDRVLTQMEAPAEIDLELLKEGIEVKNAIVLNDPFEKGERKTLNFGHTIGHIIEGYNIDKRTLTHGHAVAIGMIFEAFLSVKKGVLEQEVFSSLEAKILRHYPLFSFSNDEIQQMVSLLMNDKKNRAGKILTCLLEGIGNCSYDHEVSEEDVIEVFLHYKNQQVNLN